ncbi:hypothetical protein BHE74_00047766 [Ensete ventricosum]|nr:hypothetical protein BHE74_00047766 [Ensete ventricosum]
MFRVAISVDGTRCCQQHTSSYPPLPLLLLAVVAASSRPSSPLPPSSSPPGINIFQRRRLLLVPPRSNDRFLDRAIDPLSCSSYDCSSSFFDGRLTPPPLSSAVCQNESYSKAVKLGYYNKQQRAERWLKWTKKGERWYVVAAVQLKMTAEGGVNRSSKEEDEQPQEEQERGSIARSRNRHSIEEGPAVVVGVEDASVGRGGGGGSVAAEEDKRKCATGDSGRHQPRRQRGSRGCSSSGGREFGLQEISSSEDLDVFHNREGKGKIRELSVEEEGNDAVGSG